LKNFANSILNEYSTQENKFGSFLDQEKATFIDENENVKVKIIITSLTGQKDKANNENLIEHMEFYMFVKVK